MNYQMGTNKKDAFNIVSLRESRLFFLSFYKHLSKGNNLYLISFK